MFRLLALLASVVVMAACTNPNDLDEAPVDLGDFRLGHNVVVASKMTRGPVSREATAEEWQEALGTAISDRFGRYEGDKLYHLGVSVEGYVLAYPGIPIVGSPNSVLILLVTVWDDAAGAKMNEPPEQITIMETISGNTILGSGLTQSKAVQMQNLSRNASKQIETFLVRRRASQGWFGEAQAPMAEADDVEPASTAADGPLQQAALTSAPADDVAPPATASASAPATARPVIGPPTGAMLEEPEVQAPQGR